MVRVLFTLIAFLSLGAAENGLDGWLRYAPLPDATNHLHAVPASIIALNSTKISPIYTAGVELQNGIKGILGKELNVSSTGSQAGSAIVVGTLDAYIKAYGQPQGVPELEEDGFWLNARGNTVEILGQNERGALYGAFEYLSSIAQGKFEPVTYATAPNAPIRWVNQWDNLIQFGNMQSIEHGYGGPSIFFKDGAVVQDTTRAAQYARLLASIRVNAVIVTNVNSDPRIFKPHYMEGLGRIADAFRPYGVQLGISVNFGAPKFYNITTSDPFDPTVISWWTNITNQMYERIPDFAGYCVKASSEGQPGPLEYGRTLADGANLFAKALQPHGGVVLFRAFVYNQLNESNWKADRAKASVDHFKDLDGKFDENVVIQIKYGPIDFQVREPVHPLFAHLKKTGTAIEYQVAQEYLGQQLHLVYLAPLWKTILDFDLRVDGQKSLVRDIISGKRFNRPLTGSAAVVNVGSNTTWVGSHLAMSNLYAYGRLAWDPTLDAQAILEDWTRLTFGADPQVLSAITNMSMASWPAYENYTGNLGIQTLADITYTHYGPKPASLDNNGWGQWTRADRTSIGMDRTVSNGTGFSGQYPPEVAAIYESLETTPDNFLLWAHHVKYDYRLRSGETVIQHFYNAHYNGAATAQTFVPLWESLKDKIDSERYEEVLFRLKYQAGHSLVWRDAINNFYYNLSGIPDEAKRVGNHPYRIEAEDMTLTGYKIVAVNPFESASKSKAVVIAANTESSNTPGSNSVKYVPTSATATAIINFPSGVYDVAFNYFDLATGRAQYELYVGKTLVGKWIANNEDIFWHEPFERIDGHSATRKTFPGIRVQQGDELKVVGVSDRAEFAPFDYVSFLPQGVVD
ncbi:probable Probable alpha-glucuronidase A [Rhynchosporium graminicola]|uniref:Alpha-glucuronidase n=1 Tax=Rhynchosporium graminicola TaxID=2792576 RepID=A0A1E1KNQ8_9HELO|nr:probable Probable alpha-glucuronidase A [Rhynchosporium commune]